MNTNREIFGEKRCFGQIYNNPDLDRKPQIEAEIGCNRNSSQIIGNLMNRVPELSEKRAGWGGGQRRKYMLFALNERSDVSPQWTTASLSQMMNQPEYSMFEPGGTAHNNTGNSERR